MVDTIKSVIKLQCVQYNRRQAIGAGGACTGSAANGKQSIIIRSSTSAAMHVFAFIFGWATNDVCDKRLWRHGLPTSHSTIHRRNSNRRSKKFNWSMAALPLSPYSWSLIIYCNRCAMICLLPLRSALHFKVVVVVSRSF